MKKLLPLILAVCILFCACDKGAGLGKPADDAASPTSTVEPSPIYSPNISGESGVFTDWGKLTPYDAGTQIYTRQSEGPLTELKASGDYGMLLPYVGAHKFTYGEWGGYIGDNYGLVTMDGRIVLDPILSGVYQANWHDGITFKSANLDILIMETIKESSDASEGYKTVRAVAAADGSWCTGFDYDNTFSTSMGVICAIDEENNIAICYGKEGNIVFDTRDFPDIDKLSPNSLWGMDWPREEWAMVWLEDKGCSFLSPEGRLMRKDGEIVRFDSAGSFSEGLAPARSGNFWGYIDTKGDFVIAPQYSFADSFYNGIAIVENDASCSCALDTKGNILKSFEGFDFAYRTSDLMGEMGFQAYNENETMFFDLDLKLVLINGIPAQTFGMGLYAEAAGGLWIRYKNKDIFIEKAKQFNGLSEDGSIACVIMEDGSYAVVNSDGQTIMSSRGYIFFTDDMMTDRQYIVVESGNYQTCTIYDERGKRLVTDAKYSNPTNGLFQCEDELYAGWKNLDNEWVFRISVDAGD